MSPVEQDRPCDGEEVEAWIAGVDPITTWVTVEMPAGLTSYEVLVVRDEHNSEIGAVLVLDCEPRGRHWSAAQFNMIDFNPVLRDGDPEALATAAVERLRAEEECTCGSTRLLEGVLEQHVHELRDILTGERACPASPVARLIAQTVRDAATLAGVAVASPQLARWILRGLYEGCDGWNSSDEDILDEIEGHPNDQLVMTFLRSWYRYASAVERALLRPGEGNHVTREVLGDLRARRQRPSLPHRQECPLASSRWVLPATDEVEREPRTPSEGCGVLVDDGEDEECATALAPVRRSVWELLLSDPEDHSSETERPFRR